VKVEKISGKVILYVGDGISEEYVEVPDLIGKNAQQANGLLMGAGLNVRILGPSSVWSAKDTKVSVQSYQPEEKVKKGTVVTLTFGSYEDD
jgi:beta-lactam-binding protein with PASTA domain